MTTIVIADAYGSIRFLLDEMITGAGFNVIGMAKTGMEAYQLYKLWDPDLLILDSKMTQSDGTPTALQILKENSSAKLLICMDEHELQDLWIIERRLPVVIKSRLHDTLIPAIRSLM